MPEQDAPHAERLEELGSEGSGVTAATVIRF